MFTFSNACTIQLNLGTNEFLKKLTLENMGYWQNESEIEKKGRVLQSTTGLIRVKEAQ